MIWLWLAVASARAHFTREVDTPPAPPRVGFLESDWRYNILDGGQVPDGLSSPRTPHESYHTEVNVLGGVVGGISRIGGGTVVNVQGGAFRSSMDAFGDSQVNISGGFYISGLPHQTGSRAFDNTHVNITGGVVDGWHFSDNSTARISGGILGDRFSARSGSEVTFVGSNFRVDGQPVDGLDRLGDSVLLGALEGKLLSGVLADGTPFAFAVPLPGYGPRFDADSVRVVKEELPPLGFTVINSSWDPIPNGLREPQTFYVQDGATVGDYFTAEWGSNLIISGGTVGRELEAAGAVVDIIGGSVGPEFQALGGSVINISGGFVARYFRSIQSEVNITGGTLERFTLRDSSTANISGGDFDDPIEAARGSVVNVSNGAYIPDVYLDDGSVVNVTGGTIGGAPPWWPLKTSYDPVALVRSSVANVSDGRLDNGIGAISRSIVNVSGTASIGKFGNPAASIYLDDSSIANISGGVLDERIVVTESVLNVSGVASIPGILLSGVSVANITGGSVDGYIQVENGSQLTISGGRVTADLVAAAGSHVQVIGTEFLLNGDPLQGLLAGDPFIIAHRDVTLTGRLRDGSGFRFPLQSIEPNGVFTVKLVPEPCAVGLAIATLVFAALPLKRALGASTHRPNSCRYSGRWR